MMWSPGGVRAEIRYRYRCLVCGSGSPDAYLDSDECEPWRVMHERTNWHRDNVAHFIFHYLTSGQV